MVLATLTFSDQDQMVLNRFDRVRITRGHKKVGRTIRELAIERLSQLEQANSALAADPAQRSPEPVPTQPPGAVRPD